VTATPPTARAGDPPTTLVHPPFKHNLGFNKLRQFHLTAYGGDGHTIDDPRGIVAVKLAFKDDPDTGDDDEVTVFGVNAGAREIIYNPTLVDLAFFGDGEMGGDGFADPVGIGADGNGLVVVGDRGNNRVVYLRVDESTHLRFERSVTLEGSARALSEPAGVAVAQNRVYVADGGNDRVAVLDTAGVYLDAYPCEHPFGIAVLDGFSENYYGERCVVVTDRGGKRLLRISLDDGSTRAALYAEATGGEGGFDYPALDYDGNTFVTDTKTGCVYKFDRTLSLLARFECGGDDTDDLDAPRGITIHRRLGQVFVAENTGVSYYWIGTDVTGLRARFVPAGDPAAARIDVRYVVTERSDVSVALEREAGGRVVELAREARVRPGAVHVVYRVDRSDLPCSIAECTYRLTVRARATYSSRKHLDVIRSVTVR
jgi:outer membrane protein assembly factor BamB